MKIGFLITACLKSSRLPCKVITDLSGKTIIECFINKIREIQGNFFIVRFALKNPWTKCLLSLPKILIILMAIKLMCKKILHDVSQFFGIDYLIEITADNSLILN